MTLTVTLALAWGSALALPPPAAADAFAQGRALRSGPQRDSGRAFALIEGAAKAGHPAAMFILSAMLMSGEGAPRNAVAARDWLEAAAGLEYPEAIQQLALNFQDGTNGYRRDPERAAELLRELAHAMTHRAMPH